MTLSIRAAFYAEFLRHRGNFFLDESLKFFPRFPDINEGNAAIFLATTVGDHAVRAASTHDFGVGFYIEIRAYPGEISSDDHGDGLLL